MGTRTGAVAPGYAVMLAIRYYYIDLEICSLPFFALYISFQKVRTRDPAVAMRSIMTLLLPFTNANSSEASCFLVMVNGLYSVFVTVSGISRPQFFEGDKD